MTKYVHEETFFRFLAKLVPSLSIIIVAAKMGENFSLNVPPMYSCCTKAPIRWRKIANMVSLPILSVINFIMCFIGLGMQITIFVKLKQVESRPPNDPWPWAISYDTRSGDVETIAKSHSLKSHCKVSRHSRNLVSPIGSCVSFIVCLIWMLVTSYYIFNISPSGPGIVHDFLLFMAPSKDFFLVNFIGTICSPTLTKSLFESIQFGPV